MSEEVPNNIQIFSFGFIDNIKDLCTNKANKKSCLVTHTYNDLILMHLLKIPKISQGIGSCFAAII